MPILYVVSRKTSDEESFQPGISGTQVGELYWGVSSPINLQGWVIEVYSSGGIGWGYWYGIGRRVNLEYSHWSGVEDKYDESWSIYDESTSEYVLHEYLYHQDLMGYIDRGEGSG
jgi:hypothetical protein